MKRVPVLLVVGLILFTATAHSREYVSIQNEYGTDVHATIRVLCENGIHKETSFLIVPGGNKAYTVEDAGNACCWSYGYFVDARDTSGMLHSTSAPISAIGRQWGPAFTIRQTPEGAPVFRLEHFTNQGACGVASPAMDVDNASYERPSKP